MAKFLKCKKCGDKHLTTCDGGHGHDFKVGDKICCIKKGKEHLHFCDSSEFGEGVIRKEEEKNSEVMKN